MAEASMEEALPPEAPKSRSTRPGKKRLFLVISILLSFIFGLPFWLKSTEIYRTPLPFISIEEQAAHVMSASLVLPCHFHFIFTGQKNADNDDILLLEGLEKAVSAISEQMHNLNRGQNSSHGGCGSSFTVMASLDARNKCLRVGVQEGIPVWPCGLMDSRLLEIIEQSDDQLMDEFLWNYSQGLGDGRLENNTLRRNAGGIYTVLIMNESGYGSEDVSQNLGELQEGLEIGLPGSTFPPGQLRTVIGKHRHAWIVGLDKHKLVVDNELVELMSDVAVRFFMNGGSYRHYDRGSTVEKGETMPLAADGKAILSFSLLNAEPSDWIFDWDFNRLEKQFLSPVVEALRPVALLTVESQVLYYTPKAVRSFWDGQLNTHVVHSKDLPFFVNANEWHLDTSTAAAGRSKLLHFAIYVPSAVECPLHLKLPDGGISQTNGFTSPGWGGVAIFNPSRCTRDPRDPFRHLSVEDLEPVMQVIIAQLRILFGLPPVASEDTKHGIFCVPAVNTGFSEWELDVLLRRRAAADVVSCASTLRSLSHLVQSLPNMVIMDEIGDQVRSSLLAAKAAEENALLGAYNSAAEAARKARAWAEEAFFQPSIMSLLYLPLEHHFAIYTPFFVPVLLHTFLAAAKEITRYRRERRNFLLHSSLTNTS